MARRLTTQWIEAQGPVLQQRYDAVAILSANGNDTLDESLATATYRCSNTTTDPRVGDKYSHANINWFKDYGNALSILNNPKWFISHDDRMTYTCTCTATSCFNRIIVYCRTTHIYYTTLSLYLNRMALHSTTQYELLKLYVPDLDNNQPQVAERHTAAFHLVACVSIKQPDEPWQSKYFRFFAFSIPLSKIDFSVFICCYLNN